MNKIKNALIRFMYGRYIMYGGDALNRCLQIVAIVILLLNIFILGNEIVSILVWAVLIFQMYRLLSKNITRRRKENEAFLKLIRPITKRKNLANKAKQDPNHKYFICPKCGQNVRVPKGRGKITITCPKCGHKFNKRS